MKKLTLVVLACMLMAVSCMTVACHRHKYSEEWSSDETHHWRYATCEHEQEIRDRAEHSYGQDNVCIICNRVKQVPDPDHQHTYSEDWIKDESYHWHGATCEHKDIVRDKIRHNYDADYVCIDCGYAHEHTFNSYLSMDDTYHWYASTCGHNDIVKDKAEHDYDEDNKCTGCIFTKPISSSD